MFGAAIGAREQRIFSGKCDRSDGSFDNVVVEFDATVIDEELASGQHRGEFTRAAYDGAEVDQSPLYGFGR
jgi:hypothetical protein